MDSYINNIYISVIIYSYIKLYCGSYHQSVISRELGYNIQIFNNKYMKNFLNHKKNVNLILKLFTYLHAYKL